MAEENKQINSSIPQKKAKWKSIITVICFVMPGLFPLGLILMWTIAPWEKKTKITITVALAILTLIISIIVITQIDFLKETMAIVSMITLKNTAETIYSNEGSYGSISCSHLDISPFCQVITLMLRENPIIYATDQDYCAYARLFSEKYFCIDSQQAAREVEVYPGEAGYCDGKTFVCPLN